MDFGVYQTPKEKSKRRKENEKRSQKTACIPARSCDCTYLGIYRADRDKDDSKSSNT